MTSRMFARLAVLAPVAFAAAGAWAGDAASPATPAGAAPATAGDDWQRFGRAIDPNTFVVGHPASPRWQVVHANHEHPAVVAKREWDARQLDANTFLVQPPAMVTWREHGDADSQAVAVGTAPVQR